MYKDLDKIVAKPTYELDVKAVLVEPTEFIREDKYSKNILDDLLNHDNLSDEF